MIRRYAHRLAPGIAKKHLAEAVFIVFTVFTALPHTLSAAVNIDLSIAGQYNVFIFDDYNDVVIEGSILAPLAHIENSGSAVAGNTAAWSWNGTNSAQKHNPFIPYISASIPPSAPDLTKITLTLELDNANLTGAAGSVESGVTVEAVNSRTGASVSVTVNADGAFSLQIQAQPGDTLELRAVGDSGQASDTATLYTGDPIPLVITFPAPGAALTENVVVVEGTYGGAANTGITVDGVTALVYDGRFRAEVPLQADDNTLVAHAVDLDGGNGFASITVQSQGTVPELILTQNVRAGLAPLTVSFGYEFSGEAQNVSLDADGDGAADVLAEYVYTTPGWYTPQLTVTDTQGTQHSAQTLVLVQDGAAMDDMFREMWNNMNNALLAGNKDGALKYLNQGAQYKYEPVFDVLMLHFAEIVASYSPLARASVSEYIGEYAVVRPFENQRRLFLVYFLKGNDGLWRLDEM